MQNIRISMLAMLITIAGIQGGADVKKRSARQPFPERGFWVTETTPNDSSTIVRFYISSNQLLSEKKIEGAMDVRKLSTRKYLNKQLSRELAKDTLGQSFPKLYEMD